MRLVIIGAVAAGTSAAAKARRNNEENQIVIYEKDSFISYASLHELNHDAIAITYCNKGVTGNATQNILLNNGFKEVYNLSGGHKQYSRTRKSTN